MKTLPATGWLVAAVTAVALLWCHGAYTQAHAGTLATPAGAATASFETPALPGEPAAAPGCVFAAKSTGKSTAGASLLPTPSPAPAPAAAFLPDAAASAAPAALLAPALAPHHASLFQQAVLLRI